MHTPGPWAVMWDFSIAPADHSNRLLGAASDNARDRDEYAQTIANVELDRHGRGDRMANARLIAAAPDLLVALRSLLTAQDHRAVKAAYAAIAKATGA